MYRSLTWFQVVKMSGEKSKRNSVSRPNSQKGKENKAKAQKEPQKPKDNDGDEEMTVVVPPTKAQGEKDADIAMNGTEENKSEEAPVDPKVKVAAGMFLWYFSS